MQTHIPRSPRTLLLALAAIPLAGAACSGAEDRAAGPSGPAGPAETAPAPVVHPVAAPEEGVLASAYLIETAEGVIAIDAALRLSDARRLRAEVDRIGRPLLAVVLTHGHPDHYNGVTELIGDRQVPVIATAGVDQVIRRDDAAKEAQWRGVFGDEWPAHRTFPTRVVAAGETLELGGARLTSLDIGAAESHHDTVWLLDGPTRRAFVGDLVFSGVHSYLSDGHSGAWLAALDRLEGELTGATLYPGHGAPGGAELIAAQRAYLTLYRDTVRRLAGGASTLGDEAKAELTRTMVEHLGNERLGFLIGLGADAVAAELATMGAHAPGAVRRQR